MVIINKVSKKRLQLNDKKRLQLNDKKRLQLNDKKRLQLDEKKQAGGSPAYRLHGNTGLLSQTSLEHSQVGLTVHEQGFPDHIVSTSGGGRRKTRRNKRSKRNMPKKTKSRKSRKRDTPLKQGQRNVAPVRRK